MTSHPYSLSCSYDTEAQIDTAQGANFNGICCVIELAHRVLFFDNMTDLAAEADAAGNLYGSEE